MVDCEDVDGGLGERSIGWHRLRIVRTVMAGFGVDGMGR